MITFPNAKINLGLNITEKRPDGYHNLETIFYPVQLKDGLEVIQTKTNTADFRLHLSGNEVIGEANDNLVVKAYYLLKKEYSLPPIEIYLHKNIPSGAGLGGGSSDAAFMLKLLNENFKLNIKEEQLIHYSSHLGADCAFFIKNKPVFASGIGDIFSPIELDLSSYHLILIKPDIFVSTKEAFSKIRPHQPQLSLKEIIKYPVTDWKEHMINDFEKTVFEYHPAIREIKNKLYDMGAIYASMSGSGSSLYGIVEKETIIDEKEFPGCFIWKGQLSF